MAGDVGHKTDIPLPSPWARPNAAVLIYHSSVLSHAQREISMYSNPSGTRTKGFTLIERLYNSINFNLSVAFAQNNTGSLTPLSVYLCPSDSGPSVVPVFEDPPDPNNPGSFNASHIVDTLSRGNYVGMSGIGEIYAQSGALDSPNKNGAGPLGQHAGIFYRNSATSVAGVTDGTSNTIMVGERSHNLSYVVGGSLDRRLARQDVADRGRDRPVQPLARGVLDSDHGAGVPGGRQPYDQQPGSSRRGLLEQALRRGKHAVRRRLGPLPQGFDQPGPVAGHGDPSVR